MVVFGFVPPAPPPPGCHHRLYGSMPLSSTTLPYPLLRTPRSSTAFASSYHLRASAPRLSLRLSATAVLHSPPSSPHHLTSPLCAPSPPLRTTLLHRSTVASKLPRSAAVWLRLPLTRSASLGVASEKSEVPSLAMVGAYDLLIVGPGVLGRLVAEKWQEEHPGCKITGETVTTDHHDELMEMGINPTLKGHKFDHKFPFVIFCAPPSRSADYPGDVREATSLWDGEGAFLFTSSSAPYDCNDNGQCFEDSPIVPIGRSPRTDVLLKAEKVVMEAGGCVVRLAGLYKADRGAHVYWLQKGTVEAHPDHILNLIHYEDAASLSVAILKKKVRSRIFLGCDNHPLSRQEVMDLVAKSGKFDKKFVGFTGGSNDPLGKKLNNSRTREEIGWEPTYTSFSHFLGLGT